MRLPGRFEWKILGSTLLIGVLTVGAAAYVVDFASRRFLDHASQHQDRTGGASLKAAELFRAYFEGRKDEFRRRAAAIASNLPARLDELAAEGGLLEARLLEGDVEVARWSADDTVRAASQPAPPVRATVATSRGPTRELELTFGIPRTMYDRFRELRDAVDRERELERAFDAVALELPRVFVIALLSILAAAPLLGLALARRATARVAKLRDAARRVGEGDLSVRVGFRGRDELDELGRAFDGMVEELSNARARLEYVQKVAAWQEVARRLAHEIKNPLTPIQLAVQELATKYSGDDPKYRRLLATATEILHEEITSLRRLVDDFSAFAKLSRAEPVTVDVARLVSELVRQHPEWQDHVRYTGPAEGVSALADRVLLRRVLINLVENAIQAAQGASRTPEVELIVEPRTDRERAAVIVDDNGPGVPVADRQRIFDPYVTNKEGGTGLGLAIVRKIVIDHGGDVSVGDAPAPLGGARLVVELPQPAPAVTVSVRASATRRSV